ncbi:CDP-alcohol phosphatidyltransferase family protein [Arcticibacterium luteifluviistationis]|uniref:CDP-alcohol phosphatidyltransferase n=1 Tax=Arcticibacterium luteifluviistationis TaxID=1784714 RepID=A0A2Z4GC77_9BACT|nr:CDP-alcohol phosphatidyltransferase family protein [Arcticibacterium luteifluviistationis]AWV98533.1 CDP-alcohol phosphatidyltransferase [Arcticibacterium luteifluviistationis]
MSKLSPDHKFLDFSDYGRSMAKLIVSNLINTKVTPIQLTLAFGVSGLLAVYCIFKGYFILAGVFLILKSILDAADGELARQKNTPSYVGRYLDSIFDILLNLILLLLIGHLSQSPLWLTLLAFICVQMQGTLYNYYYVILRNISVDGDQTSKVFEQKTPKAFEGEKQSTVNTMFLIFQVLYSFFDRTIQILDNNAHRSKNYPNWFMSLVSIYGLGFQLLIIAIFLAFGKMTLIIPFFIGYTILLPFMILVRKALK